MSRPIPRFALRVLEPPCVLAGEADNDDVLPAVLVDIVREGEEVIRVVGNIERLGRIEFESLGELRPGIPEWAGDDIHCTVAIEIAEAGAFAEELIRKLGLLE